MLTIGKKLLLEIINDGYKAYIVGGAVRDVSMGVIDIHDVDIATNMPIEKIKHKYHTVEYGGGEKHGTVIIVYEGYTFELTQFRSDGCYTDGRHPDHVTFIDDFEIDCSRRDFTINSMGMNADGSIVDFHNGLMDISIGLIKTVGPAHDRFKEDALRMIRALRFAARYNFKIDDEIVDAISCLRPRIKYVAKERIFDEFKKTISYGGLIFATFIKYMHESMLLKVVLDIPLVELRRRDIEFANSNDVNLNLCLLMFGESRKAKFMLKLPTEFYDSIEYVTNNFEHYTKFESLSYTQRYKLVSHKHFELLRNVCDAKLEKINVSPEAIEKCLKLKPMYDKHGFVSECLLKHINPGKQFGITKAGIVEMILARFSSSENMMSDDELRYLVDSVVK